MRKPVCIVGQTADKTPHFPPPPLRSPPHRPYLSVGVTPNARALRTYTQPGVPSVQRISSLTFPPLSFSLVAFRPAERIVHH